MTKQNSTMEVRSSKKTWNAPAILAVSKANEAQVGTSTVHLDFNVGDSQTFVS